jgi:uncharacterized DUF497 family protein
MEFEWDKNKSEANLRKHGVGFTDASTVWNDFFYVELFDHEHSSGESRYLMVGESESGKFLIVSFTERENKTRITSARELTPVERRAYEHGYFE